MLIKGVANFIFDQILGEYLPLFFVLYYFLDQPRIILHVNLELVVLLPRLHILRLLPYHFLQLQSHLVECLEFFVQNLNRVIFNEI